MEENQNNNQNDNLNDNQGNNQNDSFRDSLNGSQVDNLSGIQNDSQNTTGNNNMSGIQSDSQNTTGNNNLNDNQGNHTTGSTYHYGINETPYRKETINDTYNYQYYQQGTGQSVNQNMNQNAGHNAKQDKKEKKKKHSKGNGKKVAALVGSAVAFGCIAGAVMFGVNVVGNKVFKTNTKVATTEISPVTTSNSDSNSSTNQDVADVVENVMPSIVSVTNTSVQRVRSWFQSYEQEVQGAGSGIIIGESDGEVLIATNNHVIDGAKEITITFCDDESVEATVKGTDSISDLAVLAVKTSDMKDETVNKIKVAALGSSDDLRVGESAIAIGNALGYGQSVTVGYISALNREVEAEDASTIKMLQTDAAINPGNSGGALLNEKGEVIGINSAKYVDSTVEGMGYAIPISDAIPIINELMNQEVIADDEQGYLGIQGNDITDEYASGFNMPKGVYVVKILDDSPASSCGLKAGDIITKIAGREITSMENLQSVLSNKKAGEEVELVIQRNNEKGEYEEVTLKVTLGAKKDMPDQGSSGSADTSDSADTEAATDEQQNIPDELQEQYEYFFGN